MNHIRFVDHNAAHSKDFIFDQPKGHDCYLLLLTHTPARFWVDGQLLDYPENSVILYRPGAKIYYCAADNHYENDWLRFDSDEFLVSSLPIQNIPFSIPDAEYCHHIFCLLTWEYIFPSTQSEQIIDQLIEILFTKLHAATAEYSHTRIPTHYQDLLSLRKQIYKHPENNWKISDIASALHLSPGYFHSLYRNTFHVSCTDDVISCRIRLAKDLLQRTGDSIQQIADACGYNNVEHFCRQFKKVTGKTPGQYRQDKL